MKKNGFTLVELLAVIAILAILVIIAMPNVLDMFNKAKQDAFETEVRSHIKVVNSEFITSGNLVYSNVVAGAAKLPMDGEKLDYYIELDSRGNIKELNVTNGEYKIEVSGTSSNPVKIEEVGETIKSEVAKSGEEFTMSSDGSISGNSQGGSNTSEYILKGTWKLKESLSFTNNINVKEYVNFTSNGKNYIFMHVFFQKNTLPSGSVAVDSESSLTYSEKEYVTASYFGYAVANVENKESDHPMFLDYMTWYNYSTDSIVDFGSSNQEVSKEFYDWFTSNATKQ